MDKLHEDSRKQFEEWVKNQYSCKENTFLRVGPNKERYHQVVIQECWEAWQASRASIVVELPRPSCVYADHSYPAYSQKQVEDLLSSIGLSIKGELYDSN